MTTLLHIDASARVSRSLSRDLSAAFIQAWRARRPEDRVLRQDVGLTPPPAISEAWIAAAFTQEAERTPDQRAALAGSDALVDQVLAADLIVIGAPTYNYGMPAALKAWLDQVIRIDRTFTFDLARGAEPIRPVQTGKTLVMLTSSGEGGFEPGGRLAHKNHLDAGMASAMDLIGGSWMETLRIEFQEFKDERHRASIAAAHAAVPGLVERLIARHEGRAAA